MEVGQTQAAVDLDVVSEYGVPVGELAVALRRNVIGLERMTRLQVVAVNLVVDDIDMPDDDDQPTAPRVQ